MFQTMPHAYPTGVGGRDYWPRCGVYLLSLPRGCRAPALVDLAARRAPGAPAAGPGENAAVVATATCGTYGPTR